MNRPLPPLRMPPRGKAPHRALTDALDALRAAGERTPCQTRPDPFVSDHATERADAAETCRAACALAETCRAYTDAAGEQWGVWGGRDRTRRVA